MTGKNKIIRNDLLYPELSYKIIGVLFEVYNQLGGGFREKYYQKAISHELKTRNIQFQEQYFVPLQYKNQTIGKNFIDFFIEDKIILEIKCGEYFARRNIDQILSYLKSLKLKLGLLANYTKTGLRYKRIVNIV